MYVIARRSVRGVQKLVQTLRICVIAYLIELRLDDFIQTLRHCTSIKGNKRFVQTLRNCAYVDWRNSKSCQNFMYLCVLQLEEFKKTFSKLCVTNCTPIGGVQRNGYTLRIFAYVD